MRIAIRILFALLNALTLAMASELVPGRMETNLIPHPLDYTVLLPDGYQSTAEPLPLLSFCTAATAITPF